MSHDLLEISRAINLADLRDFLQAHGWTPVAHRNERIELFRNPSTPVLELIVPRSSESSDFANRVAEAAVTVGKTIKKSPEEVLRQIREIARDVLSTRVVGHAAENSSIPLDLAVRVIESLKKLLVYGSAGEIARLPFFTKPSAKAAANGRRCRFGHTFQGSFGFTVESPLPSVSEVLFADQVLEAPYERRVLERVYRGVAAVTRATAERSIKPIVENYEQGLNANMCDALIEMSEQAPNERFIFSVDWSPKIPENHIFSDIRFAQVSQESLDILKSARNQLRSMEESRDVSIEGRVVLLKSDSSPWEDEPDDEHTVVIAWLDSAGKPVRTRVVLTPTNYLEACNAHMQGRSVSVSGLLERRGKYTRLSNPHDFGPGSQRTLFDSQQS